MDNLREGAIKGLERLISLYPDLKEKDYEIPIQRRKYKQKL